MTLQEVINLAAQGELSNLSIKTNTDTILGYINLGMLELYKRFPLDVQEEVIALQSGVDIYDLPTSAMWIVGAYDEVAKGSGILDNPVPINQEDNPLSIFTINWHQIQVPVAVTGAYLSVVYVNSPTPYTQANLSETIKLPPQMIESLLHYVGYRGHAAMNGNIQAENNTHYQRFEASCNKIIKSGMFTSDGIDSISRITRRGFV